MREKIVFIPEVDLPMINGAVDYIMSQLRMLIDEISELENMLNVTKEQGSVRMMKSTVLLTRADRLYQSGSNMARRISQVIEHAAVGSGATISLIARLAVLEDGVEQLQFKIQLLQRM